MPTICIKCKHARRYYKDTGKIIRRTILDNIPYFICLNDSLFKKKVNFVTGELYYADDGVFVDSQEKLNKIKYAKIINMCEHINNGACEGFEPIE